MSATAQAMMNRTNLVKPPQYVAEGKGSGKYGAVVDDPAFIAPFQFGNFKKTLSPEYLENKYGGRLDMSGRRKTRETNQITVEGRLLKNNASFELLQWATKPKDDTTGPEESRTWIRTYNNNASTPVEIAQIANGCKPESASLSITKEGALMLSLVMSCKEYFEGPLSTHVGDSNSAGTNVTGTPTYAIAESNDAPILFKDMRNLEYDPTINAAKNAFTTTSLPYRSFSFGVNWSLRRQDSNGSIRDVYIDYSMRKGSGSIDLFKTGQLLNEDARTEKQTVAWINLENISGTSDALATKEYTVASNNKIKLLSKLPGSSGNLIEFEVKASNAKLTKSVIQVSGHSIQVIPKKNGDTIAVICNAINDDILAGSLVHAEPVGTSTTVVNAAIAKAALANGADGFRRLIFERFSFNPSDEPMLEDDDATIETKECASDGFIYAPAIA